MTSRKKSAPEQNHKVPQGKMTSLELYVTAKEAYNMWRSDPDKVKSAPHTTGLRRLDETRAARNPRLRWSKTPLGD